MYKEKEVDRAKHFAITAHGDAKRKYGGLPVFWHLWDVAQLCELYTPKQEEILLTTLLKAAWLHDTIEDTDVTREEVEDRFGFVTARIVEILSDTPPTEGMNRKERKEVDIDRLVTQPATPFEYQAVFTIRLCDLISNLKNIVHEDPGFAATFVPEKRAIWHAIAVAQPVDGLYVSPLLLAMADKTITLEERRLEVIQAS